MKSDLEEGYQSTLVYLGLEDDICGLNVFATYRGGLQGTDYCIWWQAVIDFFYRNFKSGLINFKFNDEPNSNLSIEQVCVEFAKKNPKENHDLLWLGVRFKATPKLVAILDQYSLNTWDDLNKATNERFIETIKSVYAESGVPWSVNTFARINLERE